MLTRYDLGLSLGWTLLGAHDSFMEQAALLDHRTPEERAESVREFARLYALRPKPHPTAD